MKNSKKLAVIAAALCVATAFTACKEQIDNTDTPDYSDRNPANDEQVVVDPALPAIKVKPDSMSDSITIKSTGEKIFVSEVGKLRIVSEANGSSESVRNISNVMQRAFDRNKEQSELLKNDCIAALEDGVEFTQSWAFESTYEVVRNDGYAVSICENIYMNVNAPQPTIYDFAYNFDSKTGSTITIDTLIGGTNQEKEQQHIAFDELLRSKIKSEYGEETMSAVEEYLEIEENDGSTMLSKRAEDSWYFNKDGGITVLFSTYEIAPNAAGKFEFDITADELKDILDSKMMEKYFA